MRTIGPEAHRRQAVTSTTTYQPEGGDPAAVPGIASGATSNRHHPSVAGNGLARRAATG